MNPASPFIARDDEQRMVRLALASVLHPRLGADSPLRALSVDLVRLLALRPWYPPIPMLECNEPVDRDVPAHECIFTPRSSLGASGFGCRIVYSGVHILFSGAISRLGFVQYVGPASPTDRLIVCVSHYTFDEDRLRAREHVVVEVFRSDRLRRLFSAHVFEAVEIVRAEDALTIWAGKQ